MQIFARSERAILLARRIDDESHGSGKNFEEVGHCPRISPALLAKITIFIYNPPKQILD
jgi:hypothetical protein